MKWGGWSIFRDIVEEMPWAKFPSTWHHPKLSPKSPSLQFPNRKAGYSYRRTSLWWFSQCAFQQTGSLPQDSHMPVFGTRDALLYSRTTPSSCCHESRGDPGTPPFKYPSREHYGSKILNGTTLFTSYLSCLGRRGLFVAKFASHFSRCWVAWESDHDSIELYTVGLSLLTV